MQLDGSQITILKAETTNGGHFRFDLPDFKNVGALFLRAYDTGLERQETEEEDQQRIPRRDRPSPTTT